MLICIFIGIPISYTNFYCGGVIINERWAMTSAHCFTESDISRNIDKGSWAIWNLHTTKIVIHPDYDQNFWANDIALVKLEKDLPLDSNPNIQKVRLSSFGENEGWPRVGGICVMKGWGCTASGGPQSSLAQAVELPIVATEKCDDLYNTKIGPKRLCAGYSLGEKGICRGDSGGPLVCQRTKGGPYFQEGIASFTASVNSGNYPGVFTRVSEYTDWIIKTIKEQ
ncbi:hypothetical protein CAPTEDRAFT_131401 [Capitella teleta]|uniref:Peptidase S1 domain-containing protein n=1 Tax=Capitella teleta TaxID=283909 RepID=R7V417_CAPTE|nr:hypothetical protein CAPTEDRAFT_131401 [Capitella teleta]|eukprot:ELU11101.1 hypothetical protein CAPTEDRAFT_131401 [Capitella teleta]